MIFWLTGLIRPAGIRLLAKAACVNGSKTGVDPKFPERSSFVGTVSTAEEAFWNLTPSKSPKKKARFLRIGPPALAPKLLPNRKGFLQVARSPGTLQVTRFTGTK